jgi:hypothetical protein
MTLIDLDQPAAGPAPRSPRLRARPALAGLALIVAAGVVGGLVTDRWRVQRQQEADRSAVSVVLVPDPLPRPDDSTVVAQLVGPAVVQVELAAHVDVVNAGPAPVRFVGFHADEPGLRLRGSAAVGAGPVAPGDFAVGTVHATVTCAARPPGDPLAAIVEAESADGVVRRPTVRLEWRVWADQIAETCERPAPGSWTRR